MPVPSFANALKPVAQAFRRLSVVPPREPKLTVGLDIGATAVKVVALGARKGAGPRPIVGQNLMPIIGGEEADPSDAIRSALETLNLPIRAVNLSVSGQWVIMRVVEMPTMKPAELKQALPFEVQRYLPFNVQEVVFDGLPLGPSEGNKSWVLIVACKKELLERRIDWVRRAGFEPALVDVDALSLANAYLASANGHPQQARVALIDVGSQLTNLVVLKDHIPYLVRDIPWGGEKLVRHLADQLGIDPMTMAQSLVQGQLNPEMQVALKSTCEALVAELQLSFDYVENRFGQPPEAVLVCGGLSHSSAFLDALKSHVTQAVTPWTPIQELPTQFAVAYGLALRTD